VVPAAGLDLGATGKAFAADLLAVTLHREFGGPVLAGVGGDLRVEGGDAAYPVVAGHTREEVSHDRVFATMTLRRGGLATSSVRARRWRRAGRAWHHVINPWTGRPTGGPWASVTAWGHTAVAANTASTAALVLGEDALGWLEQRCVAALLVGHDESVVRTRAWSESDLESGP